MFPIVWGIDSILKNLQKIIYTSVQSEQKKAEKWKMFSTKDFSESKNLCVLEEELYT